MNRFRQSLWTAFKRCSLPIPPKRRTENSALLFLLRNSLHSGAVNVDLFEYFCLEYKKTFKIAKKNLQKQNFISTSVLNLNEKRLFNSAFFGVVFKGYKMMEVSSTEALKGGFSGNSPACVVCLPPPPPFFVAEASQRGGIFSFYIK